MVYRFTEFVGETFGKTTTSVALGAKGSTVFAGTALDPYRYV